MKKLQVISLYTGAGGLDLGLESAGFETSIAVEFEPDCVRTLKANRRWPVIDRNIHDVPTREILDNAGLKEGEADLLAGGPPCQPFSKSGYWAKGDVGRLDDPRASFETPVANRAQRILELFFRNTGHVANGYESGHDVLSPNGRNVLIA